MDSYPGPLGQVITNLFNNALEHAFGGRAGGEIVITTRRGEGDRVVIEFGDNGTGIAEENLRRVFDPFFTTRLGQGGSGLGLNIVHNIVIGLLGGHISVASHGGGTTFTVTLPPVAPRAAVAMPENT
jgi:signal transduction histidine kinase